MIEKKQNKKKSKNISEIVLLLTLSNPNGFGNWKREGGQEMMALLFCFHEHFQNHSLCDTKDKIFNA